MLNYRQLYYFWNAAKAGGITRAAENLHLAPQTLSGQIGELERALDTDLFRRAGRRLELTAAGRVALSHAEEIFQLGNELEALLRGRPQTGELPFRVGLSEVVPKSIAYRLLAPALKLPERVRLICHEDKLEQLFSALAVHHLDLVISDRPLPSGMGVKGYTHTLGHSAVAFVGTPELARRYRPNFPHSLNDAPILIPGESAAVRGPLGRWMSDLNIEPHIMGEFDDTVLMKAFGQAGVGIFPVPEVIAEEVQHQYGVELIGRAQDVTVKYFAISLERRLTHPAVLAVSQVAKQELFK